MYLDHNKTLNKYFNVVSHKQGLDKNIDFGLEKEK